MKTIEITTTYVNEQCVNGFNYHYNADKQRCFYVNKVILQRKYIVECFDVEAVTKEFINDRTVVDNVNVVDDSISIYDKFSKLKFDKPYYKVIGEHTISNFVSDEKEERFCVNQGQIEYEMY